MRMPEPGLESFESFAMVEIPRLLRLGHALTGNPHDAWDLTQETLVVVGVRWSRIRPGSASQYARTTLIRLNLKRRRRGQREVLGQVSEPTTLGVQPVPAFSDSVRLALMELGPRQRTAVVLRHVYDLTLQQIADEMNCALGTVKSQLSRAEANLRQHLSLDDQGTAIPGVTQEGQGNGRPRE